MLRGLALRPTIDDHPERTKTPPSAPIQASHPTMAPMTRYHFDLRSNERIVTDEIGEDLPDLPAAIVVAFSSARELAADRQRSGRTIGALHIEVNEADHRPTRIVVPLRWAITAPARPPIRSIR